MQGNLREIDIYSILRVIEAGQRTGLLFVETCNSHHRKQQTYLIFFSHGQIIYGTYGDTSLSRLKDYLHLYDGYIKLSQKSVNTHRACDIPEYQCLWQLLTENRINPMQAHSIIYGLVREILFDLLSLHQGKFIFDSTSLLVPHSNALKITPILSQVVKQIQDWKQLYPYIQSPDQWPVLVDVARLHSILPPATMTKLKHWADRKTSMRQLARYLNCDILTVAKAIYPYVENGWVKISPLANLSQVEYQSTQKLERISPKHVVCISDKDYIFAAMESTLEAHGYKVTALTNPLESISFLFKLQPNFIFCQIAMPELDGYEICSMLRNSTVFMEVPIILIAEQEKLLSCIKAKIIGATDYLTVPFGNNDLVMLMEKYLASDMTSKINNIYNTC